MAALQMGALVASSVALNVAFLKPAPWLAILAGIGYAAALSIKVPA